MHQTPHAASRGLPWTVSAAAIALAAYGVAVLLNAILHLQAPGGESVDAQRFQGPLVRFVTMNVVAWGLSQRARWAWWAGVLLPGFFLLATAGAFVVYLTLPPARQLPPPSFMVAVGFLVLLLVPVVLLLTPSSRNAFKRPAA